MFISSYLKSLLNRMLAERKESESDQPKQIRYRTPASFKMEFDWLREVDSLALCNAEINLKSAFRNFFRDKHFGYPKFKSRKNPVCRRANRSIAELLLPKCESLAEKIIISELEKIPQEDYVDAPTPGPHAS